MRFWYWSQLVAAGLLLVAAYTLPLGAMMGLLGTPVFVLAIVGSLLLNQVLLANRPWRVVTLRERVLLGTEYAAIAASIAALLVESWFLETLVLWFVTAALAVAATVTIAVTSYRSRAASRAVSRP